jgi:hypothetical protein
MDKALRAGAKAVKALGKPGQKTKKVRDLAVGASGASTVSRIEPQGGS